MDLWPNDLDSKNRKAPVAILRKQARLLEQKTDKKILTRIEPTFLPRHRVLEKYGTDEDLFMYEFHLEAPVLDNYQYHLFAIFHGIEFYPVIINAEDAIKRELSGTLFNLTADNEEEFLDLLKRIFNTERTVTIINSLLSQANEISPTRSP